MKTILKYIIGIFKYISFSALAFISAFVIGFFGFLLIGIPILAFIYFPKTTFIVVIIIIILERLKLLEGVKKVVYHILEFIPTGSDRE